MRLIQVNAFDLNEAFFICCKEALKWGIPRKVDKGSFEGIYRLEFDFITINIKYPGNRPLAPILPEGINPPTNETYIEEYYSNYLINEEVRKNEQYTYGSFLVPQIPTVIERYKNHGPNCNQLTMTVGDIHSMEQPDPPCLRMIDTRIDKNKLHFYVYFRSWDLWAGFPTNLGGIQLLKEQMADAIGVKDGELVACSKGLHLYQHTWELASTLTGEGVPDVSYTYMAEDQLSNLKEVIDDIVSSNKVYRKLTKCTKKQRT